MYSYKPQKIYIERSVRHSPVTQNVLQRLPAIPVELIDSTERLVEESKGWMPTLARAKKHLILAEHKGRFFKACPASHGRGNNPNVCCNYFVINYASNCHMDCSYCYLQSYLNMPYLIIYTNVQDLLCELQVVLSASSQQFFRIGTGELADSLALDPLTSYSVPLVRFFAQQRNAVLEFKTKSNCVENLLDLDHQGKTVVSWSINPRFIQQQEEHNTATIEERLLAAEECVEAGYPVAFHFDPLIYYPEWEHHYRELIQEIFERIPFASIRWISMGTLRMSPQLREFMRLRFPNSFLPLGELVPTGDGKMRYFKPIRVQMYQKVLRWIREQTRQTPVYACMENPGVWAKIFCSPPPQERELGESLTGSLFELGS